MIQSLSGLSPSQLRALQQNSVLIQPSLTAGLLILFGTSPPKLRA